MSILIKGAKMPKNCEECKARYKELVEMYIHDRCVLMNMKIVDPYTFGKLDRPSWCPLVEIPPHGRLIDADEYEKHLASIANTFARSDAQKSLMGRAIFCLENAPTVIESEEQEHE